MWSGMQKKNFSIILVGAFNCVEIHFNEFINLTRGFLGNGYFDNLDNEILNKLKKYKRLIFIVILSN
jgi:hypothetical protein